MRSSLCPRITEPRPFPSAIATGRLPVGEQLPTVRQLAVDLRVNANTVARVYAELERGGVVETRRGVGTFVRAYTPPVPRADRERQFVALLDRVIGEAAALGYRPAEVAEALLRRGGGEEDRDG